MVNILKKKIDTRGLIQPMMYKGGKEICICAAVKTKCGKVIRGHRHADCLNYIFYSKKLERLKEKDSQGFMTSKNRFVNRVEAFVLQQKAGIKSKDKGGYRGVQLYSEDLY